MQTLDNPLLMAQRKLDHINICVKENVESSGDPFAGVRFVPECLPEFDYAAVDTRRRFLGAEFALPILITGMTGGVEKGKQINVILARAAQRFGIPLGLGSQKVALFNPEAAASFHVRPFAPDAFLIGNIGLVSHNYGVSPTQVAELVKRFELNAFALHVNALQECIQPEGERNFSGCLRFLEELVRLLPVPVMLKEIGSGISGQSLAKILETGVAAVDVGGRGGTSWSVIEGFRGSGKSRLLGELFRNWGLTTEESIRSCVAVLKAYELSKPVAAKKPSDNGSKTCEHFPVGNERSGRLELVATGGIRSGLQVAKAIALGAQMCGIGLPFLRAIEDPRDGLTGEQCLHNEIEVFAEALRIVQFCVGARTLNELSEKLLPNGTGENP